MRAILAQTNGGPEVLSLVDQPIPEPGAGELTIDVAFAGVNFVEIMQRRGDGGTDAPFVPGYEVAGRVRAIGSGVEDFTVGEPVAAMTNVGGYAEVALAPTAQTVRLSAASQPVDLESAAAFPTIVPTAWIMLKHLARMRAGETVLVHAAAGAVGTIAAQVARHLGAARIIGTVGSADKVAYAEQAGYTNVLVRDEDWPARIGELTDGRGVDIVLDSVGGAVRPASIDALSPSGRLVIFGNASAAEDEQQSTHQLWFTNKAVMGFNIGGLHGTAPELTGQYVHEALELLADGTLKIDITDVLELGDAAEAHRRVEGRSTTGKLLLRVGR